MAISGYEGYEGHDVTERRKQLKQFKSRKRLMFTLHIAVIVFLLLNITLLLLIAYIK